VRPSTQRADAERPADLVPGHGHRVQAAGREVDRQLAERLHRVGVERHAVAGASAASSATGCTVPTSLLAHITVTSATEPGRSRARLERLRVHPAAASTGSHSTSAPSCSASHSTASMHGVVLDRAGQDAAPARVLAAALPVEALDGQVVRLGAAAGEDDLAGPAPERRGERLAGLLDQPPGDPAERASGRGDAESPGRRIASTASGPIGVVAAWFEVDRSARAEAPPVEPVAPLTVEGTRGVVRVSPCGPWTFR
jgi:hypothetical protein